MAEQIKNKDSNQGGRPCDDDDVRSGRDHDAEEDRASVIRVPQDRPYRGLPDLDAPALAGDNITDPD